MKRDKTLLAAVLILICLVSWLIYLSLQRSNDVAQAVNRINKIEPKQPDPIDYDRITQTIKNEIAEQINTTPPVKDGVNGRDGISIQGNPGKDGSNGEGVYQLWLDAGNTGTVQDFLKSLKGEKGDTTPLPIFCTSNDQYQLKSKLPTDIFWQIVPSCTELK